MDHLRLEVTDEHAGVRLDQFLAGQLAERSRSQIQRLIKEGRARVGHKVGRASTPSPATSLSQPGSLGSTPATTSPAAAGAASRL